ncbi:MAG: hypothetical protein ACYC9Y_10130 [Candidatus Methylomirabilia bacterium]
MNGPGKPQAETRREDARLAEPRRTGERLAALLITGGVLLNFPLLSLLRGRGLVVGVPVLYLYLFLIWALLAGATALVLRGRPPTSGAAGDEPGTREP